MSAIEKIELSINVILLLIGFTGFNVDKFVQTADIYVLLLFHLISVVSVFMIIVLNWEKFYKKIKQWLK
jgi:hypothetical protein